MKYELIDTHHPQWRGMRFTNLERAQRALEQSVPPGRFKLINRTTRKEIVP